MARNIIKLLFFNALLLIVLFSGCRPAPPNGILPAKDILVKDTGVTVNTENDASNLVVANLDTISGASLIRILGPIDKNTLINISASKQENNRFLVNIEYSYEGAQASCQTSKVAVTVTGDGKIYGTVRLEPN